MKTVKHPKEVVGFSGTLDDLVRAIGNMSYDQLALFFEKMSVDLKEQAMADIKRKRCLLASELLSASFSLTEASRRTEAAWKICEPFMKQED